MDNNVNLQNVGKCQENKIRFNVFLTPELRDYVRKMSDYMGMSNSAFIVMCVAQYKQGQEVSKSMAEFKEVLSRLEAMEKDK